MPRWPPASAASKSVARKSSPRFQRSPAFPRRRLPLPPPAGAAGGIAPSSEAAGESAPGPVPVARADDATAPFVEAVDKLRRSIRRTEKKLIIAGRHTDQQLVRLASKTDQVARRIPELAASSVRRDQQVRRLTSIVRQLVEETRAAPGSVSASLGVPVVVPFRPAPLPVGEAEVEDLPEVSVQKPAPTVAAVSGQLEALVSRTAASMNDLRSLIADVTAPVPVAPSPRTRRSAIYDSPVASLTEELRELTALTADN